MGKIRWPHHYFKKHKRLPYLLILLIPAVGYFLHQGAQFYKARQNMMALRAIHTPGEWYRYAADRNDPIGQLNLGLLYHRGFSVPHDDQQSLFWLHKAAAQNLAPAQDAIGTAYEEGYGVPVDFAEARRWYMLAAIQNLPIAMWHIGNMHFSGHGSDVDKQTALVWYKQAASLNSPEAQLTLAGLYENGDGVTADPVQAYVWISLFSLTSWDPRIKINVPAIKARLMNKMTPDQRLKAETLVQENIRNIH